MISIQTLYKSIDGLKAKIDIIDREKECNVQIFTSILTADKSVDLAKKIKKILPKANIIGSSVGGVIYKGLQYDDTLINIEQYEKIQTISKLVEYEDMTCEELAKKIKESFKNKKPKFMKMFLGNNYEDSHAFIDNLNKILPKVKIVGGISSNDYDKKDNPYVFTSEKYIENGLVFQALFGSKFNSYIKVNNSNQIISPAYTITKATEKVIDEIENVPAKEWFTRQIGSLKKEEYRTWQENAKFDPLLKFQIVLEDYKHAGRFVYYDTKKEQISQYFTKLENNTKFRISYSSTMKCIEESKETCIEMKKEPIEQLFCYTCMFRKMYMSNCVKWELEPYHKNPVSGVFLNGEIGFVGDKNELLNGSCVLSGIGEKEKYISPDLSGLEKLGSANIKNTELFDFIRERKKLAVCKENEILLNEILSKELEFQQNIYFDSRFNMWNMFKYEIDKENSNNNKLCLVKIENSEVLMSYIGQEKYYFHLRKIVRFLNVKRVSDEKKKQLNTYVNNADSFIIVSDNKTTKEDFLSYVNEIEEYFKNIHKYLSEAPFLIRIVAVFGEEALLESAYTKLQNKSNSQTILLQDEKENNDITTKVELERVKILRYAIENGGVKPYYQGIYNNKTKKIDKYEALMRIVDENDRIYTPYEFMDVAKKYLLYLDLNLEMVTKVLEDFSKIDCDVNINISAHDIRSKKFNDVLFAKLKEFHKPENITIEILEDEYFSNLNELKMFVKKVRKYGVRIAIDDFGTGYSNLLGIVKINPNDLKIDGQIIRELHTNYESEAIVEVTTYLGEKLSINLVAEFVENKEIQEKVEKLGILYSQGYLFSKPTSFENIYQAEKKVIKINS